MYDTGLFIKYMIEYNKTDQVFTNWNTLWPYFAVFFQVMAIIAGIELIAEIIISILELFVAMSIPAWYNLFVRKIVMPLLLAFHGVYFMTTMVKTFMVVLELTFPLAFRYFLLTDKEWNETNQKWSLIAGAG